MTLATDTAAVPAETRAVLEAVYRLFNAREIDGVFAHLQPDVDWPNSMEGGRVHGYDEVRAYWTRQWKMVDPHVTPTAFTLDGDGRIVIEVHQVVKDLAGNELVNQRIEHIYTLSGERVSRMEIGRAFPSPSQS